MLFAYSMIRRKWFIHDGSNWCHAQTQSRPAVRQTKLANSKISIPKSKMARRKTLIEHKHFAAPINFIIRLHTYTHRNTTNLASNLFSPRLFFSLCVYVCMIWPHQSLLLKTFILSYTVLISHILYVSADGDNEFAISLNWSKNFLLS